MSESAERPPEWRHQALASFAHEVRTPLTSIRMVLDLARDSSGGGGLSLDAELTRMLEQSLQDLDELADGVQLLSRVERGKLGVECAESTLEAVLARAVEELEGRVALDLEPIPEFIGRWDEGHIASILAACAVAADRGGEASGSEQCGYIGSSGGVTVEFVSGTPSGPPDTQSPDLGFAFLRAAVIAELMGCSIVVSHQAGHCAVQVTLPAG